MPAALLLPIALSSVACSDAEVISEPAVASVEGDVLAFLDEVGGERVSGATVSLLEHPEMQVVTGEDAHFRFDGLKVGSDVTLVVEHPDYKTTQTATLELGAAGIYPFSVQIVSKGIFTALSTLVPEPVDLDQHCVIATTVARMGGSLYVHLRQGAPDVQVSLSPEAPSGSGPIYFDEDVLPAVGQPATSKDGGVLFYNVPPGDYLMSASRADTVFNQLRFRCRAGFIVNAGPPDGLLANVPEPARGAGKQRPGDDFSEATDTLCETTAQCVNDDAGAVHYPAATVASCKAMFSDTWAFVDDACDGDDGLKEAARALYVCRAQSCDTALGGDDVCVDEEAAFSAAQASYGACLSAK